ncbi:MAG: hypothetical protein FWC21_04725 [Treponema sp.]|nr:hypothetical protein [Treponema sp.]
MRKEKQIGIRVGLPAFFALELEDVYKHSSGAHRALAFPDFIGLLVGMGLEAYRKQNPQTLRETDETEASAGDDADDWDFPVQANALRWREEKSA